MGSVARAPRPREYQWQHEEPTLPQLAPPRSLINWLRMRARIASHRVKPTRPAIVRRDRVPGFNVPPTITSPARKSVGSQAGAKAHRHCYNRAAFPRSSYQWRFNGWRSPGHRSKLYAHKRSRRPPLRAHSVGCSNIVGPAHRVATFLLFFGSTNLKLCSQPAKIRRRSALRRFSVAASPLLWVLFSDVTNGRSR